MTHLYAVPHPDPEPAIPPDLEAQLAVIGDPADHDNIVATIAATAHAACTVTDDLETVIRAGGADLTGPEIVALRQAVAIATDSARQAARLIDELGNRWCWDHGTRTAGQTVPTCRIGDDVYRPVLAGQSKSLKVDGRKRITNDAMPVLTDWLCRQYGADPDDPGDDTALTVKMIVSLLVGPLTEAFTFEPNRKVLAYSGDDPTRPRWNIRAADYETETDSDRRKTFIKIQPKGDEQV